MVGAKDGDRTPLTHALVLLNRYSIDLTHLASRTLGRSSTANREIQVFLAIAGSRGIAPSAIAASLGIDRSTTSRILHRFESESMVVRRTDPDDHRSARLALSAGGRRRLEAFSAALEEFFVAKEPVVGEVLASLAERPAPPEAGGALNPVEKVALLTEVGSRYTAEVAPALAAHGVSDGTEIFALAEIRLVTEARPTDLMTHLQITSGGVSQLLDRLEREDLVHRGQARASTDGRCVGVTLTPRGAAATSVMLDAFARHLPSIGSALAATMARDAITSAASG